MAAVVDLETTGYNPVNDEVIQMAIVLFAYDKGSGQVYGVVDRYSGYREPATGIHPGAAMVHGLTAGDVRGRQLDIARITAIAERAEWLVAHNASFDRGFLRRLIPSMDRAAWHCTMRGIDWDLCGFGSRRLEWLIATHGLTMANAHDADADADATLSLIAEGPYTLELLGSRLGPVSPKVTTRRTPGRERPIVAAEGPLNGHTVVVTGTMEQWTREEIEDLNSLPRRQPCFLSQQKNEPCSGGPGAGSKLVKALEFGIRVVNESQFLRLIAEGDHSAS